MSSERRRQVKRSRADRLGRFARKPWSEKERRCKPCYDARLTMTSLCPDCQARRTLPS